MPSDTLAHHLTNQVLKQHRPGGQIYEHPGPGDDAGDDKASGPGRLHEATWARAPESPEGLQGTVLEVGSGAVTGPLSCAR